MINKLKCKSYSYKLIVTQSAKQKNTNIYSIEYYVVLITTILIYVL